MPFQHVAEQIYFRPWLITPSGHASVKQLFESKFNSAVKFEADESSDVPSFIVPREPASLDVNGIGHISIKGVIGQGLSPIEKSCGATDTRDVQNEIASLLAQGAKGILISLDSPGGTVTGIPELAETIVEAAAEIPVFVFSDSQICSAAYWLAAGASKIICTESAEIGSIGVYYPWIDSAGRWEQEGIKADPVINQQGKYKAIGFGPSLSEDGRAQLQAQVERIFGLFRTFVVNMRAMNEATVPDAAMQGQVFLGIDGVANGLADELADKATAYELLLSEIEMPEEVPAEPTSDSESVSTTD